MKWVRLALTVVVVLPLLGIAACCCSKKPKKAAFDPAEQYPEWAYDAPFYYRPATEYGDIGERVPPAGPGCPVHFYTRDRYIYLPRPKDIPVVSAAGRTPEARFTSADLAPRIAVYWTTSNGLDWRRAGYFGVSQTHYVFEPENDGTYGFRFVGPGLPAAQSSPPRPMVVYHVDTTPPEAVVYIERVKEQYRPNDRVAVHWSVTDVNLSDKPVVVWGCWGADSECEAQWSAVGKDLPAEGSLALVVPAGGGGKAFKVRVNARDRAGNVGVGASDTFLIAEEKPSPPQTLPVTQPTERSSALELETETQAGFVEPAVIESEPLPDVGPMLGEDMQRLQWRLPPLPPLPSLTAAPTLTGQHWSARSWQTLRPEDPLDCPSVWLLPMRRGSTAEHSVADGTQ